MYECVYVCACVFMCAFVCAHAGEQMSRSRLFPLICGSQISNSGVTWWQTPFPLGGGLIRYACTQCRCLLSSYKATDLKTTQWSPCVSPMSWAFLERRVGSRALEMQESPWSPLLVCSHSLEPVHRDTLSFLTDTDVYSISLFDLYLLVSASWKHPGVLYFAFIRLLYFADLGIICNTQLLTSLDHWDFLFPCVPSFQLVHSILSNLFNFKSWFLQKIKFNV